MEENAIIPSGRKVILIGGSAGSLDVLLKILPDLTAIPLLSLVIVVHRKSGDDVTLEELVALKTAVPVREVEDKTALVPGYIYIAPSGYHLLFEKTGLLSLDTSEKVNYSRPSIDVTFESAAGVYSQQAIAILLSGANADGTLGLMAIQNQGGMTIVQNPETAEMPFMPQHAIFKMTPDYVLDVQEIAAFIQSVNS